MSEPEPVAQSRFAGLGQALRTALLIAAAVAAGVGLLGVLIAWAADRHFSSTIALTYYFVGSILFMIGLFPTGGFSIMRGTITRRKPTGSGAKPVTLLGLLLIGLGVIADCSR